MGYQRVRKLHLQGETPVIRGAVIVANVTLYVGPTVKRSLSLDPKDFPVQTNSLTAWLRIAAKRLGKDLAPMLVGGIDDLTLIVNNGDGAKRGRGCNNNEFELQLLDDKGFIQHRLHFAVTTESHIKRHIIRKATGQPIQKRTDWSKETYYYARENVIKDYDRNLDVQLTWDVEEYYAEYPHRRGQLKVRLT